jgi:hypothetical protein
VTLVAVGAVLLTLPSLWSAATAVAPPSQHGITDDPRVHGVLLVVTVLCTALLLASAVAAAVGRASRVLRLVDAAVLALGSIVAMAITFLMSGISDEGVLTDRAATAFLHGQPVYGVQWQSLFASGKIALTPTMSGGADYSYGYPPGAVLLIAGFRAVIGHATSAPALVGTAALIVAVVVAWLLTPAPWRSLVTLAGLGTSMLPNDARAGYPAVIALALLVPVVAGWHRTGADGRLGKAGLLRAAALGAACSVHQTAWFFVPFLVVGVWALRRSEVGPRRALLVAVRYALVAAGVWGLIDLPFALRQPVHWFEGLLLPITQHAIVHGQGLIAVTEYLTPGSGAIAWFGAAQLALLLALVVLLAIHPHRLAVALPILRLPRAIPPALGARCAHCAGGGGRLALCDRDAGDEAPRAHELDRRRRAARPGPGLRDRRRRDAAAARRPRGGRRPGAGCGADRDRHRPEHQRRADPAPFPLPSRHPSLVLVGRAVRVGGRPARADGAVRHRARGHHDRSPPLPVGGPCRAHGHLRRPADPDDGALPRLTGLELHRIATAGEGPCCAGGPPNTLSAVHRREDAPCHHGSPS